MTDGPYARLYLASVDDPKFVGIYENDHHWATWARLLMIAEPAWPSSAHLPRSARAASVKALAMAGLIDLLPGDRYRIHGLDAERESRMQQAKKASNARWNADSNAQSNAASNAQTMPNQAKPSKAEVSPAQPAREDAADAYWSLTGRYPQGKVLTWIDDLMGQFGAEATTKALVRAHIEDPSTSTLLGRTSDYLKAEARALDRKEREDEQRRVRENRMAPRELPKWEQEFRASIAARYAG